MAVVVFFFFLNLREFLSNENKKNRLSPKYPIRHAYMDLTWVFLLLTHLVYISEKKKLFQEALLRKWVLPAFQERV